jgi:hypothetical protein
MAALRASHAHCPLPTAFCLLPSAFAALPLTFGPRPINLRPQFIVSFFTRSVSCSPDQSRRTSRAIRKFHSVRDFFIQSIGAAGSARRVFRRPGGLPRTRYYRSISVFKELAQLNAPLFTPGVP